jgi:hypothetical protein
MSDSKVRKSAKARPRPKAEAPPKTALPAPPAPPAPPVTEEPPAELNEVWAEVRGKTYHGTFSVADGWVEVIADDGQYKTGQIGESTAQQVAERLLAELYKRSSVGFDD